MPFPDNAGEREWEKKKAVLDAEREELWKKEQEQQKKEREEQKANEDAPPVEPEA